MEPYKAKKLPLEFNKTSELFKIICDTEEIYGEYKGYLRNMNYDYKSYLECAFVNDLYYSFKLDGAKLEKEYMFHTPYMNPNNEVIEFNNLKKALVMGVAEVSKGVLDTNTINMLNKCLFMGCKKTNTTKGSGKYRKIQNYLLKPGIAGSSISFIPPHYSEINGLMKDLEMYINGEFCKSSGWKWIDNLNPSTEEVISRQPEGTIEDVNRALDAARDAQKSWGALPSIERAWYLLKIAQGIKNREEDFINILMREQWKNRKWAEIEVGATISYFEYKSTIY